MPAHVTKADGSLEFFKIEKLRRSLRRSGASVGEIQAVVETVTSELYDGIHTQEIYRRAFDLLRQTERNAAARYSLRRALFALGPSGFPFEQFLGRLFEADGYTARTGIIMNGRCAPHEIDIAAYSDSHSFIGEAKFHARPGIKSDLQVALYSYARFLDLQGHKICTEDYCGVSEFWLITNTKFTTTAEKYAQCVGLKLLSWDYPRHNNLHDRIQRAGIYPLTVLSGLTNAQTATLIERGIILCSELVTHQHVLHYLHLPQAKAEAIIAEAMALGQSEP
ncbi:ATPase [Patescibacteria group bacterium]|nr:ATPase [Patescibacteria group bacterium]